MYADHPTDGVAKPMAMGLFNLSNGQDPEGREKCIDELRGVYADHPTNEVAKLMAMVLVNLSNCQDLEGREKSVDELRGVYADHPTDEVAKPMAMGVFNLAVCRLGQGKDIFALAKETGVVFEQHPTIDVGEVHASLVSLLPVTDIQVIEYAIREYEKLVVRFPENLEYQKELQAWRVNLKMVKVRCLEIELKQLALETAKEGIIRFLRKFKIDRR